MGFDLFRGHGVPWSDFVEDVRAGTEHCANQAFHPAGAGPRVSFAGKSRLH